MAIQDSINQVLGTVATVTTANKHLKNQAEGNLISAENNLGTAIAQEAQAKKEKTDALGDALKFENENPNLSDEQNVNKELINNLNVREQELSKSMFDKHPRNEKGQFISQMEHQQNVSKQLTEVNKDLEMARKARDVIENKLITRSQLKSAVDARETQLKEAQDRTSRAKDYLAKTQEETKWLVGGKK